MINYQLFVELWIFEGIGYYCNCIRPLGKRGKEGPQPRVDRKWLGWKSWTGCRVVVKLNLDLIKQEKHCITALAFIINFDCLFSQTVLGVLMRENISCPPQSMIFIQSSSSSVARLLKCFLSDMLQRRRKEHMWRGFQVDGWVNRESKKHQCLPEVYIFPTNNWPCMEFPNVEEER